MTWNPNKPSGSESPSLTPAQIQANWQRLQTMNQADHIFNATADTDDGWHKIVHHVTQAGDIGDGSPTPVTGTGLTYTKTITTTGNVASTAGAGEHLCYQRGTNGAALQEAALSVCPIRAAVSFQGDTGATSTINWAYNVTSVTRNSTGDYTIIFTAKMPSIYYIPSVQGQRVSQTESGKPLLLLGGVRGGTYADSVKEESLRVYFGNLSTGNFIDPQTGFILIYGG